MTYRIKRIHDKTYELIFICDNCMKRQFMIIDSIVSSCGNCGHPFSADLQYKLCTLFGTTQENKKVEKKNNKICVMTTIKKKDPRFEATALLRKLMEKGRL